MGKSSNMPSDVIFDKKFTLFGLAVYRYWKSPTKKKLSILGIPVYSWRRSGYSITSRFLFFRWKTKKRFQQLYDAQNRILSELIAVCNAQKEANAVLKSKLVTVGAGLADLQKQHDALANRLVLLAEMIHGISRSNRAKPCICIVSPNFAGGGLERRINNFVNSFEDKYEFMLATECPRENMLTHPSSSIKRIIDIDEIKKYLHEIDCFDIHPFLNSSTIEFLASVPQKKIYTLHGEHSIGNFTELLDVDKVISVSQRLKDMFVEKFPYARKMVHVERNIFSSTCVRRDNHNSRNIVFIVTNASENSKNSIAKIIKDIPKEFKVTLLGRITDLDIKDREITYAGWNDVSQYLEKNDFLCGFSRGGFCSIDILSHGIPAISFYDRDGDVYLTPVTKSNFEEMYNNNFVSYDLYDKKNLQDIIQRIFSGDSEFDVRDRVIANTLPHDYFDI